MKKDIYGIKHIDNKVRLELVLPKAIIGLGEVLTYGANKYGANTWQDIPNPEDAYYGALLRHIIAWRQGEVYDKESGISHLKHVLSNAMFLLYYEENRLNEKQKGGIDG